jgi:hypothetical protein
MDARYLITILLACFLLAGCQSGGNTELMERELRLQEDRIYYLEDQLARCCEAAQAKEQAALQSGRATTAPATRRSMTPPPAPVMPDAVPKVELELPGDTPAPNSLPSLFDSKPPASTEPATAMRIVRPAAPATASSPSVAADSVPPPRMRFASTLDDATGQPPSRVMMQWSAAPEEREGAETHSTPRTASSTSAAPRRPQWSPYR